MSEPASGAERPLRSSRSGRYDRTVTRARHPGRGPGQDLRRPPGARRVRPRPSPPGTVCGLLGPNGAGKTTAVRILTTLLRADGGSARVAGADVRRQAEHVRHRIGLSGQEPAVDEILSGRQNLVLFGRLNGLDRGRGPPRADELLDQLGLVRRRRQGRSSTTRAACAGASTSASRSSWRPPCSSSTSPPPASTPQPQRGVVGHPGARRRRHDRAAHHPVPRRGRPAGRRRRGHGRGPGHRAGHARRAQGPGRRRPARRGASERRGRRPRPGGAIVAGSAARSPRSTSRASRSARRSPTASPR